MVSTDFQVEIWLDFNQKKCPKLVHSMLWSNYNGEESNLRTKIHSRLLIATALVGAATVSAPAVAAPIGNGTVTIADLYIPTVNLDGSSGTYTASSGLTSEVLGTGAFVGVTGLTGIENGTLTFSNTVGTTLNQTANNFFTFMDGLGGNYSFTATSVTTRTYNVTPGVTSSISLYLLGNTSDAARGFDPTPTSLTLSFNNTGTSPFSSAATLSIPPAGIGAVPESATWAMFILGFGAIGYSVRKRKATITQRSFA